jgi:hypothetical protein
MGGERQRKQFAGCWEARRHGALHVRSLVDETKAAKQAACLGQLEESGMQTASAGALDN